jgi:hypothetical protein
LGSGSFLSDPDDPAEFQTFVTCLYILLKGISIKGISEVNFPIPYLYFAVHFSAKTMPSANPFSPLIIDFMGLIDEKNPMIESLVTESL